MSLAKELSEYLITIDVEGLLGSDQIEVGQSTLELWEDLPSKVDVAIFIIGTAEIEANGGRKFIPRQNLMFELGLFHAKLGRQRTIILASGAGELPTDIMGTVYIRFSPDRLPIAILQLEREFMKMGLLKQSRLRGIPPAKPLRL